MSIEQLAREFATEAHAEQLRKYTGAPYITHLENVVSLVKTVQHSETMLAAAWLHDVVEDTPKNIDDIIVNFGLTVAVLVENLTDISRPEHGNRRTRKALDLKHTANALPAAKTIKLADLIDNTRSIIVHDPAFARVYLEEKEALLEVLREGDQTLYQLARQTLREAQATLGAHK